MELPVLPVAFLRWYYW